MSDLDQLLVLQQHDLRILQLRHRLDTLPERQGLADAHAATRAALAARADAEQAQTQLEGDLAAAEAAAAEVADRAAKLERSLYDGSVSDSGQLQDMQKELTAVQERQRAMEDGVIEQMEATEAAQAALADAEEALAAASAAEAAATEALAAAAADVEAQIEDAQRDRDASAGAVVADLLAHYEQLARHLTPAVARLEHGHCGGCHLEVAATELDHLKRQGADARIHCEQCGCLLVLAGT